MKRLLLTLLNLFAILLVIWLCDLAAGRLYPRLAPPLGKHNVALLLGQIDPSKALSDRPHPYLLFENTPEYVADGVKQVNAQGYRNESDTQPEPTPGVTRILCLGGSTTYGYLLDHPGDAWPAQLEAQLNAKGKHVEVINGGLNYAMAPDLLLHYLIRDRYLGSKIVILHVGANDASPLLFANYSPEYETYRGTAESGYQLRAGEKKLLLHSNMARLFYASWLNYGAVQPFVRKQIPAAFDQPDDYYVENALKNEPVGFARDLDLLVRNIIADGDTPVLFPEELGDRDMFSHRSPEAVKRAEYMRHILRGAIIAGTKVRQATLDIAERYHLLVIERPTPMPSQYYLDQIHLSKEGEAIEAQTVAEALLGAGGLQ